MLASSVKVGPDKKFKKMSSDVQVSHSEVACNQSGGDIRQKSQGMVAPRFTLGKFKPKIELLQKSSANRTDQNSRLLNNSGLLNLSSSSHSTINNSIKH